MEGSATGGALDGLRVVDFGQYLAGPLVGMFLADHGADVVHVDPPGGPRWDHPANAALYRNKRSVVLDLKADSDRDEVRRLIECADVVVENFRPGVMARLGLAPDAAIRSNARLIWCSIPGFASWDPRARRAGWEGVVSAAAGLYPPREPEHDHPRFSALPLASTFAAFCAAHRVAAALLARINSGRGQHVEVSMFEAAFQVIAFMADAPQSKVYPPSSSSPHLAAATALRPTADGTHLYFDSPIRGFQRFLDRFLPGYDVLDLDESASQQLAKDLDELIAQRPAREWERIGQEELGAAFGLVQPTSAWLEDRHARDSSTVVAVDDGPLGPTAQAGFPVRMSRTPPEVRWGRGANDPQPGTVVDWLGPAWADPAAAPASTSLPLEGVRVLDCSTLLAGPTTARVLAQYGAEVIKLDKVSLAVGVTDPLSDDDAGFVGARTVSSGKRTIFVDLKHPAAKEVVGAIVAGVDVVHHNFTPSAAARVHLDPDGVRALNPSAIVSTMSLHSQGGFRADYRGHDMLAQMVTGMANRAGGADVPCTVAWYVNDNASGHLHAFGIMLALLHRLRTGEPQDVNASLSRTATLLQVPFMIGFEGRSWDEPAGLDALGWHALDRLYRARDDWFYLGAPRSARARLDACSMLGGVHDVTDADLEPWLEARFAELTVDECVDALNASGLGAHRNVAVTELVADDVVLDHDLIAIVDHPGLGPALGIGHPVFDTARSAHRPQLLAMRRPGSDTIEVLQEFGFGDRIVQLLSERAIAIGEATIVQSTAGRGWWNTVPKAHRLSRVELTAELRDRIEAAPREGFVAHWPRATQ
jgi:crotonobetainyl-CoA:carnitine CoA-transferase CaiB-like acyl-CoA transferase